MRGWMTRVAIVAALVGFAVPALACDGMKTTHASTTTTSSSSAKAGEKSDKAEKTSKKSEAKKPAVASAEAKR